MTVGSLRMKNPINMAQTPTTTANSDRVKNLRKPAAKVFDTGKLLNALNKMAAFDCGMSASGIATDAANAIKRVLDNLFKHLWHHYSANGSILEARITECGKETHSDTHCNAKPQPMSDKRPLKGWQVKAVKIVANKTNFD